MFDTGSTSFMLICTMLVLHSSMEGLRVVKML